MQEKHREPWEVISMLAAGFLALSLWHCVITVMDYAMFFVSYEGQLNLIECIEIPFLL